MSLFEIIRHHLYWAWNQVEKGWNSCPGKINDFSLLIWPQMTSNPKRYFIWPFWQKKYYFYSNLIAKGVDRNNVEKFVKSLLLVLTKLTVIRFIFTTFDIFHFITPPKIQNELLENNYCHINKLLYHIIWYYNDEFF